MKRLVASVVLPVILLFASADTTGSPATLVAAQAAPADAVTADPARYSVLFENDLARLIRVKYPRGTRSVMHSHPAGCAMVNEAITIEFKNRDKFKP